jgi:cytochrome P450
MMGIGEEHYEMLLANSNIIIPGADPEYVGDDLMAGAAKRLAAGQELQGLIQELAGQRARKPADDLISTLVNANVDGESLTVQELGSFFILLVVAGNETTRNAIAHGLRLFTDWPAQRALLCSDLDRYLPGAVEEIVRYTSPVVWMRRSLTCDYEMGGHQYREGDKVLLYYWSANRDESVFDDPHAFDIARSPNPHLGFGGPGPHFCLGANLARHEIAIMFRELFTRLPDIRATGVPQPLLSSFVNGIKHMTCEFTPSHRSGRR